MASRSHVAPTLELLSKTSPSKLFELDHRLVRIGRDRSSDICLDDRRVSASHVQILKRNDGSYLVEDLNSYNKTWLNGVKLDPYVPTLLTDGSTIKLCDHTFVFRYEAVAVREDSATSDLTILGSLEDMSSVSLSSRGNRSSVVLRGVGDQSVARRRDRSQRSLEQSVDGIVRRVRAGGMRIHPHARTRRPAGATCHAAARAFRGGVDAEPIGARPRDPLASRIDHFGHRNGRVDRGKLCRYGDSHGALRADFRTRRRADRDHPVGQPEREGGVRAGGSGTAGGGGGADRGGGGKPSDVERKGLGEGRDGGADGDAAAASAVAAGLSVLGLLSAGAGSRR